MKGVVVGKRVIKIVYEVIIEKGLIYGVENFNYYWKDKFEKFFQNVKRKVKEEIGMEDSEEVFWMRNTKKRKKSRIEFVLEEILFDFKNKWGKGSLYKQILRVYYVQVQ